MLSGVGDIVARTLLRVRNFCADFLKDRSDCMPEGIRLPVAVRTGQAHGYHAPPVPLYKVLTKAVVGAMQRTAQDLCGLGVLHQTEANMACCLLCNASL